MIKRHINNGVLEILSDDTVLMSLTEVLEDGGMHISISGELRNEVAHEFEDELMAAFSVCKRLHLDLSKTVYIASFAMKALLSVQQIVDEYDDAGLLITGMSPAVKKAFDEAGFLDILNIAE